MGLIAEMIITMKQSLAELRDRVSNIRYGEPGTILFDFDGETYAAPEPVDVMPVGAPELAQKKWALTQILDKKASKVYLKKNALYPSERIKVCDHKGLMQWSGAIPCTGVRRCRMCGYVEGD